MPVKLGISLLCCLILLGNGCGSKSGASKDSAQVSTPQTTSASPSLPASVNAATKLEPAASPALSAGFLDACALIEKSEIASVQGSQVQAVTPSSQTDGALAISQCYYAVSSADGSKNLSVHLQVMRGDGKSSSANAVRTFWEKSFGREKDKRKDSEEKAEGGSPPQPVPGIGEEAFWIGSSKAGAVYALKKGNVVRVSVGGPDDVKTKIEKSKTLIARVLKRLS